MATVYMKLYHLKYKYVTSFTFNEEREQDNTGIEKRGVEG
jgi:hypothetical protein